MLKNIYVTSIYTCSFQHVHVTGNGKECLVASLNKITEIHVQLNQKYNN